MNADSTGNGPKRTNRLANHLLQLILQHWHKVLGHSERLTGNVNGGNSLGLGSIGTVIGHALLHGDVIGILAEEIGHRAGVLLFQVRNIGLVFLIGHGVSEDLLASGIGHHGIRGVTAASVGLDAHLLSGLGLDGELDLVEVGPFLARGSLESLHGGEVLIGGDGFNVIDGHIVEGNEKGKLVDGHILEHSLAVALEALTEGLGGGLVRVIGDESDVRSLMFGGKVPGLGHVLANVLVVSHEDGDVLRRGLLLHGLKEGNRGSTGFFEVNSGTSVLDGLAEDARVVGRTSRNETKSLYSSGRGGKIIKRLVELDAVLSLHFLGPFGKFRSSGTFGSCCGVVRRGWGAGGVVSKGRA
jgi:hypothetical protein